MEKTPTQHPNAPQLTNVFWRLHPDATTARGFRSTGSSCCWCQWCSAVSSTCTHVCTHTHTYMRMHPFCMHLSQHTHNKETLCPLQQYCGVPATQLPWETPVYLKMNPWGFFILDQLLAFLPIQWLFSYQCCFSL